MRVRKAAMVMFLTLAFVPAAAVASDDQVGTAVTSIGASKAAVWSRLTIPAAAMDQLRRFGDSREDAEHLLRIVYYEAYRAGVDPSLVLAIIEVESAFDRFAVSRVGAMGYMQVMPFWRDLTANEHSLLDPQTNIRYGCAILASYIQVERGDLYLALGRYNGSRGRPEYPRLVFTAWERWSSDEQAQQTSF